MNAATGTSADLALVPSDRTPKLHPPERVSPGPSALGTPTPASTVFTHA